MADRLAGASGLRRPGRSSPVRSCFVEVSPNPIGQDEHVEKGLAELPSETYVPNELLSRLVGDRMYSVEFVLNDYVQFRFDGTPGAGITSP